MGLELVKKKLSFQDRVAALLAQGVPREKRLHFSKYYAGQLIYLMSDDDLYRSYSNCSKFPESGRHEAVEYLRQEVEFRTNAAAAAVKLSGPKPRRTKTCSVCRKPGHWATSPCPVSAAFAAGAVSVTWNDGCVFVQDPGAAND